MSISTNDGRWTMDSRPKRRDRTSKKKNIQHDKGHVSLSGFLHVERISVPLGIGFASLSRVVSDDDESSSE